MEMTSCLFRKDVPRPRSVSARCWDAQGGKTRLRPIAGSLLLEYTLPPTTPPTYSYAKHKSRFANPHRFVHTGLHIYHTLSHAYTKQIPMRMPHTTIFLPNISHKRISTHATMTAHTYTTGSELCKYPESHTDVRNHSLSPYRWPHSTCTLRWEQSSWCGEEATGVEVYSLIFILLL